MTAAIRFEGAPAGYDAEPFAVDLGARRFTLFRVKDLERHVDRAALLRDDTAEPPYWAHLWTGALSLARYVDARADVRRRAVLDLGCGLGLPGIVAARNGGRVTFADKEAEACAFALANARANACRDCAAQPLDFTRDRLDVRFDYVLAAEILYDKSTFAALAGFIADHLAKDGQALLADAGRTDTRSFYAELDRLGLAWTRRTHTEREDGLPLQVHIVIVRGR